jgi:hypothetical protein
MSHRQTLRLFHSCSQYSRLTRCSRGARGRSPESHRSHPRTPHTQTVHTMSVPRGNPLARYPRKVEEEKENHPRDETDSRVISVAKKREGMLGYKKKKRESRTLADSTLVTTALNQLKTCVSCSRVRTSTLSFSLGTKLATGAAVRRTRARGNDARGFQLATGEMIEKLPRTTRIELSSYLSG